MMIILHILAPTLGAVAVVASTVTTIFSFSFAIVLARRDIPIGIVAIVACIISVFAVLILIFLLLEEYQRARTLHRSRGLEVLERRWKKLPQVATLLCLLASTVTIATLAWMEIHIIDLPQRTIGTTLPTLLEVAFSQWGLSTLAQLLFLLNIALTDRKAAKQSKSVRSNSKQNHAFSRVMHETSWPVAFPASHSLSKAPIDLRLWPSNGSNGRKRSGSDAIKSLRVSITQVVRPISSKSRLISTSHSQKRHRPTSLDSGAGEREPTEDGFDSWDTSAVDAQSRQFVMSTSALSTSRATSTPPSHSNTSLHTPPTGTGRFLERTRHQSSLRSTPPWGRPPRSRSLSPSTSIGSIAGRQSRAESPTSSEAHIHPLFRTDSPTSPPAATPGTVVTAAPGAGSIINDRRVLHRMHSGSLSTSPSPLIYSDSADDTSRMLAGKKASTGSNVNCNVRANSGSTAAEEPPERELTPPIPEWILGAGQRNSMSGYTRRKGPLVPVSERAELVDGEGKT